MLMSDEAGAPAQPSGDTAQPNTDPSSSSGGESQAQPTEASSQLPENLKGKSPEQLAGMYQSLEKKLGEHSSELNEARKYKQDMDQLLRAVWSDPELYRAVERAMTNPSGNASGLKIPDNKKGDELANDKKNPANDHSDVRIAEQNRAISEFETKHKFNDMPADQRKQLNKKIATELAELRDPGGKKSIQEVIREIPVHQLDAYLEKAYWLSVKDTFLEKGSFPQDFASIGSLSASSGKSESDDGLTESELKVARGLRIDPKKYAERKKQNK